MLPFSYNWRYGGENDLQAGFALLERIEGSVCWDFGAHFGIHTVGMAMRVGTHGKVASFEPDPVAFRRLSHHVKINGLTNISLFQAAASVTAEQKRMIVWRGLGSSYSHFRYEDETESEETSAIRVQTVVPDELVEAEVICAPDLIKVDVQGHGAQALKGSLRSLQKKHPIIVFSNHSKWELENTRALLAPIGYHVHSLSGELVDWDWLAINGSAILVCHK